MSNSVSEDDVGMQVTSFVLDNNRGLCQNTIHYSHPINYCVLNLY